MALIVPSIFSHHVTWGNFSLARVLHQNSWAQKMHVFISKNQSWLYKVFSLENCSDKQTLLTIVINDAMWFACNNHFIRCMMKHTSKFFEFVLVLYMVIEHHWISNALYLLRSICCKLEWWSDQPHQSKCASSWLTFAPIRHIATLAYELHSQIFNHQ